MSDSALQNGTHASISASPSDPADHTASSSSSQPLSTSSDPSIDAPASTSAYPVATAAAVSLSSSNASQAAAPASVSTTTASSTPASSASSPTASAVSTAPPPSSVSGRVLGVPDGLKVVVHFRAAGDAPILKKAKFMLNANYRFIVLIDFLRKHLHYKPTDALVRDHTAAHAIRSQQPHSSPLSSALHLLSSLCLVRYALCCVVRQFLFCSASFSPSPDALIFDLHACFQLNNELVINYATQDAWG